jgi:hypothetical protein
MSSSASIPLGALIAARRTASFLRARLIHLEISATRFFSVKLLHRSFCFIVVQHFHEGKSTRPARFAIHDHANPSQLPERLKQCPQIAFRRLEMQIPYE